MMAAISIPQYPTTSRDDLAERELSVDDAGLSVPWSRLLRLAKMRTPVTRRIGEVEPKSNVERQRSANAWLDDAAAPRAAGSNDVSLAARRD